MTGIEILRLPNSQSFDPCGSVLTALDSEYSADERRPYPRPGDRVTEIQRFCHTKKFTGVSSDVVLIPIASDRNMVFLSGISAEAPDGRWLHADVPAGNASAQVRFVWTRIGELLGLHGGTYGDIVKVTFYTTDARYLMNPIGTSIKDVFGDGPVPAFTGVVVVGLAWPELLVEIDVIAVIQSSVREINS